MFIYRLCKQRFERSLFLLKNTACRDWSAPLTWESSTHHSRNCPALWQATVFDSPAYSNLYIPAPCKTRLNRNSIIPSIIYTHVFLFSVTGSTGVCPRCFQVKSRGTPCRCQPNKGLNRNVILRILLSVKLFLKINWNNLDSCCLGIDYFLYSRDRCSAICYCIFSFLLLFFL